LDTELKEYTVTTVGIYDANCVTQWSRVFLEKLIVAQLVNQFFCINLHVSMKSGEGGILSTHPLTI